MEITAKMVKELREMTGAGVMACKNALVETDGDFDAAIERVRKMSFDERLQHSCVGPSRADIFNAAGVIFSQIYKDLGAKEMIASLKSAVDGIVMELQNGTN